MFDEFSKALKGLNGRTISVPIDVDENGFVDKQCPSPECEFIFKVNDEDWTKIFKDNGVWCPMCRHEAPSDQWFTKDQVEHAESEAMVVLEGKLSGALRKGARNMNRRLPKKGMLTMSVTYKGAPGRTYTLPAKTAEVMQLEIQCETCSARFAVIGSAFFCPCCGANSVLRTYEDSLRKIRAKVDSELSVREALSLKLGKDAAELACRSLVETCLSDGVTAFQRFCEGLYEPHGSCPQNTFQRIGDGSEIWRKAIGYGYDSWLSKSELRTLNVLYQKRHILAHQEGIVDERYIEKSGDATYKNGQRLVISKADIEQFISLLGKLSNGLLEVCERLL
ncbi:MAG: hypothetical protein K8F30_00825 [Taibaiella sp.]|nr:hypothetical protein [Taibaiella sp.]